MTLGQIPVHGPGIAYFTYTRGLSEFRLILLQKPLLQQQCSLFYIQSSSTAQSSLRSGEELESIPAVIE